MPQLNRTSSGTIIPTKNHPTYVKMIVSAVRQLQTGRKGVSGHAIRSWLHETYGTNLRNKRSATYIRKALRLAITAGHIRLDSKRYVLVKRTGSTEKKERKNKKTAKKSKETKSIAKRRPSPAVVAPAIAPAVHQVVSSSRWLEIDPFGALQCFAGSENNVTEIIFAADVSDAAIADALTKTKEKIDSALQLFTDINIKVGLSCYGNGETFVESQYVRRDDVSQNISDWIASTVKL
ncbi:hypothetical protein PROFUN_13236 [Planoprotostelium fungivorum]|uniref:H15 domain-containing protein n=1 Tax=Planoprotostelium fungivorum TaxID=1890364 RepID=A0A2P6N4R5_9EUKA|nr:hypothetical protein PROFUN_13236 [Planoprotostelium fungivorum]